MRGAVGLLRIWISCNLIVHRFCEEGCNFFLYNLTMMKTLLFSFMLLLAVPLSTNCQSERVYICTGSSSKAYHRTSYCRGLNNCRASVKAVSKATAVQMGRVPCKICYWYSGVFVYAAGLDDLCGLAHYGGTTGHYCRDRNSSIPGHLSLDEGPVV